MCGGLSSCEKWDGSGYPAGLAGEAIPQSARLVALADVFDALSMQRPYKEAWGVEKIVAYVDARSGTDFDPALVAMFHRTLPELLDIQRTWDARDGGLGQASGIVQKKSPT